jgi:hypothetical protein
MDIDYETMVSTNSDFSREPLVPVPTDFFKIKRNLGSSSRIFLYLLEPLMEVWNLILHI